jgi:hypothetical protein
VSQAVVDQRRSKINNKIGWFKVLVIGTDNLAIRWLPTGVLLPKVARSQGDRAGRFADVRLSMSRSPGRGSRHQLDARCEDSLPRPHFPHRNRRPGRRTRHRHLGVRGRLPLAAPVWHSHATSAPHGSADRRACLCITSGFKVATLADRGQPPVEPLQIGPDSQTPHGWIPAAASFCAREVGRLVTLAAWTHSVG